VNLPNEKILCTTLSLSLHYHYHYHHHHQYYYNYQGTQQWRRSSFKKRFGSLGVYVGTIPFAGNFGLNSTALTLAEYLSSGGGGGGVDGVDDSLDGDGLAGGNTANAKSNSNKINGDRNYVFSNIPHPGMLADFPVSPFPPWLQIAPHLVDPMPAAIQ
jgi:hypothetical protein